MFLITNRRVHENRNTPEALDEKPNPAGPNELRLAEATREDGAWKVEVLKDVCPPQKRAELGLKPARPGEKVYSSRYVAYKLLARLRERYKATGSPPALAFFVHGYNNDVQAVLDRAQGFQDLYGVEVVAFTWPADGGGLRGTLSYRSDKRDALASVGAFDRALIKLDDYLKEMNAERVARIEKAASARHKDDAASWDEHFATEISRECPFSVNLILHSMGNYVFKNYMSSSTYSGNRLIFDNVILAAADTNSPGHAEWVDRVQCRRRLYITINENDIALRASRMKAGEEQKARLGHWPYALDSRRAVYVDFTHADGVGDSHAYFEGQPASRNAAVRTFFERALNGVVAERGLEYDGARNMYCLR